MNELSERYVEVFEHIRDTYAEFDPVPEDVLAAARGALAFGLPTLPLGWYGASPNRGRELAAFVHTSAAAIGGIRRTEFSPARSVRILRVRPATRDCRQQPALNRRLHQPDRRVQLAAGSLASIDATVVVSTTPASRLRWCCLT